MNDDLTNEEVILAGLGEIDEDFDMDFDDVDFDDDDDELSGDLGRRSVRSTAKRFRRPRRKRIAKIETGASRFRRQFLDRISKLPKPIRIALARGKAQITDAPYYATMEMKGTRIELIKPSIPEEIGYTNIDSGKLNKDRHLILSGIRLVYDANDINGTFTDPYPADLLNGEWELELNGQKVFEKQPIRKFFDGFFGYNTQKPFGLYVLNNPKVVLPQTPLEFNVNLPEEVSGYLKAFFEGTNVTSL